MTLISSKHLTLMSLGEVYSFRSNEVGRLTRCAEQFCSHNFVWSGNQSLPDPFSDTFAMNS